MLMANHEPLLVVSSTLGCLSRQLWFLCLFISMPK